MKDESLPGKQEAVDRTGGRGELTPDIDERRLPEPLIQRENENDNAYLAFMLYAMQTPDQRSNRLIAKSLGTAESNIRLWKSKFKWGERVASVPNVEWVALDVYRRHMEMHVGEIRADRLRLALDSVLDTAGFSTLRKAVQKQRTAQKSQLDENVETESENGEIEVKPNGYASRLASNEIEQIDPARYMKELGEKIRTDHLRSEDLRRQIVLIDAVLGLIAQKVKSGDLKVRVSDIPQLLKARALLTGLPTDTLMQQPQIQQHQHAHVHVVESVRMRDARESKNQNEILDAMRAEVDDLNVILNAVPRKIGED